MLCVIADVDLTTDAALTAYSTPVSVFRLQLASHGNQISAVAADTENKV